MISLWSSAGAGQPALVALMNRLGLVGYRPGAKPPDFNGPALDHRSLSLGDVRGRVVVVNCWASWCRECRSEMPALEQLHREFSSRRLAIIGIDAREDEQAVGMDETRLAGAN